MRLALLALIVGCGGEPAPAPRPVPVASPKPPPVVETAPTLTPAAPDRQGSTAARIPLTEGLKATRTQLVKVVHDHGRDPGNAWAIGHALVALGPGVQLTNGEPAVDFLFSEYAELVDVGGKKLVRFPAKRGEVRIEPHSELVLKALSEVGVDPARDVVVQGQTVPLADLYRHALHRSWTRGATTGFQQGGFNDSPWALQAIAAWSPTPSLQWGAQGQRAMSLDRFTDAVLDDLTAQTRFMADAMGRGEIIAKDNRKGLFRYTCSGQHLLQGAAWAVGSGHGRPDGKATICEQQRILDWRIDVELGTLDPMLQDPSNPPAIQIILLIQRMKFLGHYLETSHKISALGLCEVDPALSVRVADELVRTVGALDQLGVLADPVRTVKGNADLNQLGPGRDEQTFLDLIGDAAHAVRGIDLATGAAGINY